MDKERQPIRTQKENQKRSESFPHQAIEAKWMNKWVDDKIYRADDTTDKPTYFVLDMYPYPSGAGLHVGHVEGYTATDILSRYKRMNGYEVLHPMGWDAFGLPTENYAIKTGENPHVVTEKNAGTFREQCIRTGFSIDWDREIDTSKEEFYKWTQKIFLDLYKNDLAYKDEAPTNWCTGCKTVIANEQVHGAACERCNSPVEIRNTEQWFYKITAYADKLLEGLDKIDWPESTKDGQRNWIGKTEGTEISLSLEQTEMPLTVFMTMPEQLYEASFIAVAPEHPKLATFITEGYQENVLSYISSVKTQSELDRKKNKIKTGVFTGNSAINPLTGEKLPIWVSDYVIMNDSNGIRVGVPEKSDKDKDFALAQNLTVIVNNENANFSENITHVIYSEQDDNALRKSVVDQLGVQASPAVTYNLRDWNISRERYWGAPIPIINCGTCGDQPVPEDQLPVILPDMDDFTPTGVPPLARSKEFLETTCPHCEGPAQREAKTLDTFVDSAWYYLRFADPRNTEEIGDKQLLERWLPVDYYVGGADHTNGHLLYSRFITKALHDIGELDFDEPFKTVRHQGMILGGDGRKMSKRWGNTVSPDEVSQELGSDTLRLFEMFLGPLDQSKSWDSQAIMGSRRFIDRVWNLSQKVTDRQQTDVEKNKTHTLIDKVSQAIETSKFNVAVSEFMKYVNFVDKNGGIDTESYETFLKLLAPFAPFITEELWEKRGNEYSIHKTSWPIVSQQEQKSHDETQIQVMINGKFKGTIGITEEMAESAEEIFKFISGNEQYSSLLENTIAQRIIYKPGKIINILI
jgi:leucyl-tRNA synthetase